MLHRIIAADQAHPNCYLPIRKRPQSTEAGVSCVENCNQVPLLVNRVQLEPLGTHTKTRSHQVFFFVFFAPLCEACFTFPPPRGCDWTHTKPQSHQVLFFVFFVPSCEACFTLPPPRGRDWTHTKTPSHQVFFFVFFVPLCETCFTFPPPHGRHWAHTKPQSHQAVFFVFFVPSCEPFIGSSR